MKKFLPILIAVGVLVIIGAGFTLWGMGKYKKLTIQGQNVDKSWGDVESVLQRRNDIIPNLVNVVQAYAVQEQDVFIKVAEARSLWAKAQGGTIADKIKADAAIKAALLNVMAAAEQYPDLKSDVNFLALQDELAGTENRITAECKKYNDAVQSYNTFAGSFPTNIIAGMSSLPKERDYFKAEEGAATAPAVKFTYPGAAVPGVPQQVVPIQAAPVQAAPFPAPQVPAVPAGEMQAMPAPQITPPAVQQPTAPVMPTAPAATTLAAPTAPTAPVASASPALPASGLTPKSPVTAQPGAPLTPTTPAQPTPGTPLAPIRPERPTPGTELAPTRPEAATPGAPLSPAPAAAPTPGTALAPTTPAQPIPGAPSTPVKPSPANPSGEVAPQVPTMPAAPVVNTPPPATTAPVEQVK